MTYKEFVKNMDKEDFISDIYVIVDDEGNHKNILSGFVGVYHENISPSLREILNDTVVDHFYKEGPYGNGYAYILYLDIRVDSVNTVHSVDVKIGGKTYHNKVVSKY